MHAGTQRVVCPRGALRRGRSVDIRIPVPARAVFERTETARGTHEQPQRLGEQTHLLWFVGRTCSWHVSMVPLACDSRAGTTPAETLRGTRGSVALDPRRR